MDKEENRLTPEEELLTTLARRKLTDDIQKINKLLNLTLNYKLLSKLANKHQVAPIIGYHLSNNEHSNKVDKSFKREMILISKLSKINSKKLYIELDRLQRLFDQQDIKCVLLKGPGMIYYVYKNVETRNFHDLDFLLSPDDIIDTHKVLINNGYLSYDRDTGKVLSDNEVIEISKNEFHLPIYKKGNFIVELHQYGADWNLKSYVNFKDLYNRAEKIKINEESVWVLTHVDQFIWSCIHLEHHLLDKYKYCWPNGFTGGSIFPCPLKILMDIRESYLSIIKKPCLRKDFIQQINKYKNLVEKSVFMTEQVYGNFFDWSKLPYPEYLEEKLVWKEGEIISTFKKRYISPQDEYNWLTEKLNKLDEREPILLFYKETSGVNNLLEYPIPSRELSNTFNFLHTKTNKNKLDIESRFSMAWDEEFLYFKLVITDNCHNENYNYNIQILFGKGKQFPVVIEFDPSRSLKYCYLKGRKISGKKLLINPDIIFQGRDSVLYLNIPWKYINVHPETGNEFLMDIQITEINESKDWDNLRTISWATGEKHYMNSFHNICEEFIMCKVKII